MQAVQGVSEAVFTGIAPNTAKAYTRWLRQFQDFCNQISTDWTEASAPEAAIFLQLQVQRGLAGAMIAQAAAAMSWAWQIAGKPDPMKHKMVQQVISVAKRIPREIKRATPTEIRHLHMLRRWDEKTGTFASRRTFVLSLTLFFSCSRLDDLRTLQRGTVWMEGDCVEFRTGKLKNNQYQRDVHFKQMFASKNALLCPVAHFKAWMDHPECIQDEKAPIFQSTHNKRKPVTESCYRDNLKKAQCSAKMPKVLGHSHRAGYATLGGWPD